MFHIAPFLRYRGALAALLAICLSACAAFERRPPDASRSISQTERLMLGGLEQTIRIRGDDRANPVLLFLHGGPGIPEMPVAHRNAELERDFVVVQWDQRGAGKSFRFRTPGMSATQFVSDTLELSREIRRRFGGRKIVLVGFSWGSLIAARAVAKEPDLYAAYVGISQLVNIHDATSALYREALASARKAQNVEAVSALTKLGPPPWKDMPTHDVAKRWWRKLATPVPNKISPFRYALMASTSPAYSPLDFVKAFTGMATSYSQLQPDLYAADLSTEVPRLDVPVWLLTGRHDTVLSATVLERYFRTLHAPMGKHLVWFEHSDHVPHLEEAERFRAVMREIKTSVRARLRAR